MLFVCAACMQKGVYGHGYGGSAIKQYECATRVHDDFHLEIKLTYPLHGATRQSGRYAVDIYCCTPVQLGVNQSRYPVASVLGDLTSYTRYQTPSMSFSGVLTPANQLSPLVRLRAAFSNKPLSAKQAKAMIYELRTLANICRSRSREAGEQISQSAKDRDFPQAAGKTREFLEQFGEVVRELRQISGEAAHLPEDLRLAIEWADEGMSIRRELQALRLHEETKGWDDKEAAHQAALACQKAAEEETSHRTKMGYQGIVRGADGESAERFLRLRHSLRRWAESAFFLSSASSKSTYRMGRLFYGFAAALAMAFAVTTSYFSARYLQSNTLPWALAAIMAYVLKDQIKDNLRAFFMALLPRFVADRVFLLVDAKDGNRVGSTRERVNYMRPSGLPAEIRTRERNFRTALDAALPPDDVLHYHKEVSLDDMALIRSHQRLEAINEILRFDLRRWLQRMDQPREEVQWIDGGRCKSMVANRIYEHENC